MLKVFQSLKSQNKKNTNRSANIFEQDIWESEKTSRENIVQRLWNTENNNKTLTLYREIHSYYDKGLILKWGMFCFLVENTSRAITFGGSA